MKKLIATMLVLVLALGVMSSCLAEEDRTLLIYCPQSRTEFADYVSQMAMDDLGITIEWLKADGGSCRDKILEEKNNPQADLVLGLAQIMIEPLITADCLIPYTAS